MDTFNQCMYINQTNDIFGLYNKRERESCYIKQDLMIFWQLINWNVVIIILIVS